MVMLENLAGGSAPAAIIPKIDRKTAVSRTEPLCDLRFLAAQYQRAAAAAHPTAHSI
jgi:hypothetical protein